ncbi:MAG TPA: DUF2188 domain-containing protein [Caulobacteraceae bacterium]|nr:DUF2188 domain-containing protein [Caulobacteraceae bacterium]
MHVFKVVKERDGWAVRMGDAMTTPFRSRNQAIEEANCLCEALRRHGEIAQVVVEAHDAGEKPRPLDRAMRLRLGALFRRDD